MLPRTEEGPIGHCFDDGFFDWLNSQIIMIEDYPYARMKFTGYPKLVLPPSTQWGLDGKKETISVFQRNTLFFVF